MKAPRLILAFLLLLAGPAYTQPPCPTPSLCGSNLICHGDFEAITDCFIAPMSSYGKFTNNGPTTSQVNTPDLMPAFTGGCNQVTYNFHFASESNCLNYNLNLIQPGTGGGQQFAAMSAWQNNNEILVFELLQPLVAGNCYNLDFMAASACGIPLIFKFSSGAPCWNDMAFPTVGVTTNCLAGSPSTYTPEFELNIPMTNTVSGTNLGWQNYSSTFTAPGTSAPLQYLVIHQPPTQPTKWTFIDNIELQSCFTEDVEVSLAPAPASPCIGQPFTLDYTITSPSGTPNSSNIAIDALVPAGFQIVPNGDFNALGQGTIPFNSLGSPYTMQLELIATPAVTPGSTYCIDLAVVNVCLTSPLPQHCVTPFPQPLTITKTLSSTTPGPFYAGNPVSFDITVENISTSQVNGIQIQDVLPPQLWYNSATGPWQSNGVTNTSQTFFLAAGGTQTFTINAQVHPAYYCGPIDNCAEIIDFDSYCGPLTDCASINVLPPTGVALTATPNDVSCNGLCDGSIVISPNPVNYYYTLMNPPACYGPPYSTSNPVISPLSAGTYTIQVYDATTGCTQTLTATVNEPDPISLSANTTDPTCGSSCDGEAQLVPTGGTGPYTYTWSLSTISPLPNPIQNLCGNMSHQVYVIDANGCTASTTFSLVNPPGITASGYTVDPTCAKPCDGEIHINSVTGGVAPYEAHAGNGVWQSTLSFNGLCPGNHTITVRDAQQCTTTVSFTINQPPTDPWPKHPISMVADQASGQCLAINEANGEYYMSGWFSGTIEFTDIYGSSVVLNANGGPGDRDGFLVKYDDCGVAWALNFGSVNGNETGWAVRLSDGIDRAVYLAGEIRGALTNGFEGPAGTTPVTTATNTVALNSSFTQKGFVAKLNPTDGTPLWVWLAGDPVSEQTSVRDIHKRQHFGVVAAVEYTPTLTFGSQLMGGLGGQEVGVVDVSQTGVTMSMNNFTTDQNDFVRSIDVFNVGADGYKTVITGSTDGAILEFGGNIHTVSGPGREAYLAIYHFAGGLTVADDFVTFGGTATDIGNGVHCREITWGGGTAGIWVTGGYQGTFSHSRNGATVTAATTATNNRNSYIMGLNWSLEPLWIHYGGGPNQRDQGRSVTLGPGGELYSTGYFAGGPGQVTGTIFGAANTGSATRQNIWTFRCDADFGTAPVLWQTMAPNSNRDQPFDIEWDGLSNNLYLCGALGSTGSTTNFNIPITASTLRNAFAARLDASGTYFRTDVSATNLNPELPASLTVEGPEISVFPNPTEGAFTVSWTGMQPQEITILDLTGRMVLQTWVKEHETNAQLDLSEFPAGMYFVRLSSDDKPQIERVLVR